MINSKTLIQAGGIKIFPEIGDVFNAEHEKNSRCFWPLCSVDLSKIFENGSGWVHFLNIWDNGDYDLSYFNDNRSQYSIKFQIQDGKYDFNGDYNSFPDFDQLGDWREEAVKDFEINKEDYLLPRSFEDSRKSEFHKRKEKRSTSGNANYSMYYDSVLSYLIAKENFKRTGKLVQSLHFTNAFGYEEHRPISQVGGIPRLNFSEFPRTKERRIPSYVGKVTGWYYTTNTGTVHLFHDQTATEVIQVFSFD